MDDLISRQAAIREYQEVCKGIKCGECPFLIKVNTEKASHLITDCKLEAFLHDLPSAQPETSLMTVKVTLEPEEIERVVSRIKDAPIMELAPSQPDYRLTKIAELVEGTIDHFDLDDAMDLLYQIKEVLK